MCKQSKDQNKKTKDPHKRPTDAKSHNTKIYKTLNRGHKEKNTRPTENLEYSHEAKSDCMNKKKKIRAKKRLD